MEPTLMHTNANYPETISYSALQAQSQEDFYGSLQRIWDNVIQLEDMGIIQQENDKFMYAYRFAELELQRAFSGQTSAVVSAQTH